jgi:antitoxin component YwqK of YwqJK toxin-antitoxin module
VLIVKKIKIMKKIIILLFVLNISFLSIGQMIEGKNGLYYTTDKELFTGEYKTYFDNGKIKIKMNVVNGVKDGIVKYYYNNGNVKEIRSYENGLMNGIWKTFNNIGIQTAQAGVIKIN